MMRDSGLLLPKLNMPRPGTRTTAGLASRIAGESGSRMFLVVFAVLSSINSDLLLNLLPQSPVPLFGSHGTNIGRILVRIKWSGQLVPR